MSVAKWEGKRNVFHSTANKPLYQHFRSQQNSVFLQFNTFLKIYIFVDHRFPISFL